VGVEAVRTGEGWDGGKRSGGRETEERERKDGGTRGFWGLVGRPGEGEVGRGREGDK